jgi:hypothetical protein
MLRIQELLDGWHLQDVANHEDAQDFANAFVAAELVDDPAPEGPEWRDPGDEDGRFVALEDEDGGRVLIGALGVLSRFIPSQVVSVSMLEGIE